MNNLKWPSISKGGPGSGRYPEGSGERNAAKREGKIGVLADVDKMNSVSGIKLGTAIKDIIAMGIHGGSDWKNIVASIKDDKAGKKWYDNYTIKTSRNEFNLRQDLETEFNRILD